MKVTKAVGDHVRFGLSLLLAEREFYIAENIKNIEKMTNSLILYEAIENDMHQKSSSLIPTSPPLLAHPHSRVLLVPHFHTPTPINTTLDG